MDVIKFAVTLSLIFHVTSADYWSDRKYLIEKETNRSIGAKLILTPKESKVNEILMNMKLKEFDAGFKRPEKFLPALNFFIAKPLIEESNVFKFLQKLPKGASLHSHDTALASFEIVYNLTFWSDLYACTVKGRLKLHFFRIDSVDKQCDWKLIKDLRQQDPNYDKWLKTQLTLTVDDPDAVYTNINKVWTEFMARFRTITPMLTYRPVFVEHFYRALQELYDDNVQYIEFRGTLPEIYELNGTRYGPLQVAGFYKKTVQRFAEDHPEFLGARFIYAPNRNVDNKTMLEYIEILNMLRSAHGEFIAGFDLVGQEDMGRPLSSFVTELQAIKNNGIKLFFHSGETNWYGEPTDENLVDAVLLGTTRIGHGFALNKHPIVLDFVKERGIAIEINPISNQILKLVSDFRNHPGAFFFANDYPAVVCNDDPTFWESKALSYDWYEAFMGMMNKDTADLRALKQLALNSINYSSLEGKDKIRALNALRNKWNVFINDFLKNYNSIDWVL